MRLSPARILELSARALAIAGILWLLVASLRPVVATRTARVGISTLPAAAAAWARNPAIARAHLTMDSTPSMAALSAGRALRGAGVAVSWSGDVPSLAIVAAPAPDPSRSVRLTVAATTGNIVLEDDAGTLDTLSPQGGRGGAMLVAPSVHGTVRARAAGS